MPIYEYHCPDCGAHFEKLVYLSASPAEVACPSCGRPEPRRLVSTIARTPVAAGAAASGGSCAPSGGG